MPMEPLARVVQAAAVFATVPHAHHALPLQSCKTAFAKINAMMASIPTMALVSFVPLGAQPVTRPAAHHVLRLTS
jgi:hypothetical protein